MPRKGENIYKRKDKRWEGRYIKGYKDDGKIMYGYCYGKTYKEVKQKLEDAKIQFASGQSINKYIDKNVFSTYCEEWLKINRTHVKESTYVKYYSIINKYIKPKLGDVLLRNITTVKIEQFSHDLLYIDHLSTKTVKDILTIVHSIIKYISKQNIPLSIDIIYPKTMKKEMRILSVEEQKKFINYLLEDIDLYKFGVLLSLLTGMRIGEICALKWKDVSLKEKTITIRSTMQRVKNLDENSRNKTKVIISDPKSYTSNRMIPLTDFAVALCKKFYAPEEDAFVLTGKNNMYIEPRTLQYRFQKYCKACALQSVHFHTLRHTFATRCVEVDFEIKSLSQILGHSSPRITLERYVHSSMELKRSNMNKLSSIGL